MGCCCSSWGGVDLDKELEHGPYAEYETMRLLLQLSRGKGRMGLVGVRNLGNTCFLASALQCLSAVQPLTEFFLLHPWKALIRQDALEPLAGGGAKEASSLAISLGESLRSMWLGPSPVLSPDALKFALGERVPQFQGYEQNDAQEAVSSILDVLHLELNAAPGDDFTYEVGLPERTRQLREQRQRARLEAAQAVHNAARPGGVSLAQQQIILGDHQVGPSSGDKSPAPNSHAAGSDSLRLPASSASGERRGSGGSAGIGAAASPAERRRRRSSRLRAGDHSSDSLAGPDLGDAMAEAAQADAAMGRALTDAAAAGNAAAKAFTMSLQGGAGGLPSDTAAAGGGGRAGHSSPLGPAGAVGMAGPSGREFQPSDADADDDGDSSDFDGSSAGESGSESGWDEGEEEGGRPETGHRQYRRPRRHVAELSAAEAEAAAARREQRRLARDARRADRAWSSHQEKNHSVVTELFHGQLRSTVLCEDCGYRSVTFDPFMSLSLPMESDGQRAKSLAQALEAFTSEEALMDDEGYDTWRCPRCRDYVPATKKLDIWRLPPVLLVHLKRFKTTMWGERKKITAPVRFPLTQMDLQPFAASNSPAFTFDGYLTDFTDVGDRLRAKTRAAEGRKARKGPGRGGMAADTLYDLLAVSNHHGGYGGGHYTTHALNHVTGNWYFFNDSTVARASPDDVSSRDAYVLVYSRLQTAARRRRDSIRTQENTLYQLQKAARALQLAAEAAARRVDSARALELARMSSDPSGVARPGGPRRSRSSRALGRHVGPGDRLRRSGSLAGRGVGSEEMGGRGGGVPGSGGVAKPGPLWDAEGRRVLGGGSQREVMDRYGGGGSARRGGRRARSIGAAGGSVRAGKRQVFSPLLSDSEAGNTSGGGGGRAKGRSSSRGLSPLRSGHGLLPRGAASGAPVMAGGPGGSRPVDAEVAGIGGQYLSQYRSQVAKQHLSKSAAAGGGGVVLGGGGGGRGGQSSLSGKAGGLPTMARLRQARGVAGRPGPFGGVGRRQTPGAEGRMRGAGTGAVMAARYNGGIGVAGELRLPRAAAPPIGGGNSGVGYSGAMGGGQIAAQARAAAAAMVPHSAGSDGHRASSQGADGGFSLGMHARGAGYSSLRAGQVSQALARSAVGTKRASTQQHAAARMAGRGRQLLPLEVPALDGRRQEANSGGGRAHS